MFGINIWQSATIHMLQYNGEKRVKYSMTFDVIG